MMKKSRVVTLATLKGGQGKSTLSIMLARESQSREMKTLVIDLDAQSSLTDYFLRDVDAEILFNGNVLHGLTRQRSLDSLIHKSLFLDVLPSALNLSTIGAIKSGDPLSLLDDKTAIRSLDYDLIIIDSPPSPSYEFRLAVCCADIVLNPVLLDRWSVQGHALLMEEAERMRRGNLFNGKVLVVPSICSASEEIKIRSLFDNENVTKQAFTKKPAFKNAVNNGEGLKSKNELEKEVIRSLFDEVCI